jgi:dienelactone hydrolase
MTQIVSFRVIIMIEILFRKSLSAAIASLMLAGCATDSQKITSIELHNQEKVQLSLTLKKVGDKPSPTVILMHGCSGPGNAHMNSWSDDLIEWGFNVIVLDSLSGRGENNICAKPLSGVSPEQRSIDLDNAAAWVKKQKWSTESVAAIGFSHGAATVLYSAASKAVARNIGHNNLRAVIAYYPGCDYIFNYDKPIIPVQMHVGLKDTWTAAMPCKDVAKSWDIMNEFFIYENATHAFDVPMINSYGSPDPNGIRHKLIYNDEYTKLSKIEVKRFLQKNLN